MISQATVYIKRANPRSDFQDEQKVLQARSYNAQISVAKRHYTTRTASYTLLSAIAIVHESSTMAKPLATVGILSIGSMGVGVANILAAHNYRVLTNVSDRRYVFGRASSTYGSLKTDKNFTAKQPRSEPKRTTLNWSRPI